MNAVNVSNWAEANQRYLMARLARVRLALARHANRSREAPVVVQSEMEIENSLREAMEAMPAAPALETLCTAFGLSSFERDVLVLCAGMELDSSLPPLCSSQGNPPRTYPTFSLALAALPDAHWSALTPAAPLRHWRLIDVGAGEALTTSALRIDERVLHYLTGISYLDERLQPLVESQSPPKELPLSHRESAEWISGILIQMGAGALPVIHLGGDGSADKRAVAAFACAASGMQLRVMRAADVPVNSAEREALSRLWEREAVLTRSALLIDCEELEKERSALSFLDHTRGCLLAASRESLRLRQRPIARLDINRPSAPEQHQLWQDALGPLRSRIDGRLDTLVSQFDLGMEEIGNACATVVTRHIAENSDSQLAEQLWDACRTNSRTRLDDLAERIEPIAGWSDLVATAAQHQTLRDIAAQVRHRTRVYYEWGFASRGSRGLGINALFAGASGTGKTMAAEVLARDLRLDLYRIDLSQVVSKYIGETEKNLRRVFDGAEASGAILLFDEADALFGKRTEVRDSHDRYANIEISYLLQRMESYRGLAILTTNMKSVLDVSFLRRIRFIVQFPFPDAALRVEIWRRVFPAETPVANLDVQKLARLNVTGGNIRNIALHAAFLAAETGEHVRMYHLLRAAHTEYAKIEKQLAESEIRDWL